MKRYKINTGRWFIHKYTLKPDNNGDVVLYLDAKRVITKLENRILQLEAECRILMETLGK